MNKKEMMYQKIENHGKALIKFFKLPDQDPIKLSKSLLRIERKAHHATTCLCNTNTLGCLELDHYSGTFNVKQATEEEIDKFFDKIMKRLEKYIGKEGVKKCFVNHDPRGYALKIKEEYAKDFPEKDWGGYGILAPDFSN